MNVKNFKNIISDFNNNKNLINSKIDELLAEKDNSGLLYKQVSVNWQCFKKNYKSPCFK